MARLEIEPATQGMIEDLAERLRPEHLAECAISLGITGKNALMLSYSISELSWCALIDHKPVFACGVAVETKDRGTGWMLGTEDIDLYPRWILRASRDMVGLMHRASGCDVLENWIPACYLKALAWARRFGCFINELATPMGPMGELHFHVWHKAGGKPWVVR